MSQDLSDIKESLAEIKVTITKNAADLSEHMRRTALLESRQDEFTAIIQRGHGIIDFVKALAFVAGVVLTLVSIWSLIK